MSNRMKRQHKRKRVSPIKRKRGKSVALGKAVGEILWSVGKDQAKNFYNTARQRANEHAERIKRLYYYN